MASNIYLFDHNMRFLTMLNDIAVTPRGWLLNAYGKCEFSLSTSDPKAKLLYLEYGNLVYVEHIPKKGSPAQARLPSWVGIVLPNRDWPHGVINVTAYSAEVILAFRAMPHVPVTGTPKAVFLQILDAVHKRAQNIIFQPGVVDDLPGSFPDDLRTNAYDHIGKLVTAARMDWDVTGRINQNGSLELFANLYARKGIDTDLTLTHENTEAGRFLLSEQGTPTNQVFGYGQAHSNQSRVAAEGRDQSAMDDYGPLQLNQVFIGKHDVGSVALAAKNTALSLGRPVKKLSRSVLNKGLAFASLAVGNTVKVHDTRAGFRPDGTLGFDAEARILSLDYNDMTDQCPVNLEVLT